MNEKIILTDWPKLQSIEANYGGVETITLINMHKAMFHGMMLDEVEICGGYRIIHNHKAVAEELKRRNAVPKGY